ncbi:MAG TPA: ThuA domain-containing protein, partial [Gemmataceae bacterium]|nr:ThuA domain-containing protein [Gemmataceae bacterium]
EAHLHGWPDKPKTLDDADTIVFVSSGSDRKESDHPLLVGDRLAVIEKQVKRGCGLCLIHWSTFVPKAKAGDKILDWVGGYFDYESGLAKNGWYSKIQTVTVPATPGRHPITAGMTKFEVKDEFYYNLRFREKDTQLVPILTVPMKGEGEQTVAWAVERNTGSRGFGFTGGHFFENWATDSYRKMALNAILWTAHTEVPDGGVKSEFPGEREIALVPVGNSSQVLIVTGHDGPFHDWRANSQLLKIAIERDGRMKCRIVTDPEFLAREDLLGYDLIVQNYVNWERPAITEAARKNLVKYLEAGHGLAVIHFANGAFHPSLPNAKDADWPEYRQIVRRVWDHGKGLSGHDKFGPFKVEIAGKHPITEGMQAFDTVDELYYRQQGDQSAEVLVTAKSKDTGKNEPLAWAYQYGKARVFQTVLGHAAESIRADGPATLIRRGAAWAAGFELKPEKPAAAPKAVEKRLVFAEGKFGKALDARVLPASIEGDDRYRKPPITVECWAKLFSKNNFNVLVSTDPKTSGQHWEIYTYAGKGDFSVYMPGTLQGEIRSGVEVCDGKWHHLAMSNDGKAVRLFVDGKNVKEQAIAYRLEGKPVPGPLMFGGAYAGDQHIGCDGLVDEVRIANIARAIGATPQAALVRDEHTIGLWNLDGDEGISADANWTPPTPDVTSEPWQRETDKDWVDSRFQKTDTGPYLNATIDYEGPKGKVRSYKATAIKVGDKGEATVLFDRNQLRFAAAWTGGFLNHSSRRFGLLNTPTPNGTMVFSTSSIAGWADEKGNFESSYPPTGPLPKEWAKFKGVNLNSNRTVLSYTVGNVEVTESPLSHKVRDDVVFIRSIVVGPAGRELKTLIAEYDSGTTLTIDGNAIRATSKSRPEKACHILMVGGAADGKLTLEPNGRAILTIPAGKEVRRIALVYGTAANGVDLAAEMEVARRLIAPNGPDIQKKPGPARWNKPITTQLDPGKDTGGPFVVDTLPLPYDNPYNALFFVTGVDFLPDGRIAICTAHGDVWTCKQTGNTLNWKRFATGLYQPLGLKVVDGKIVVAERGQLTRLHDLNDDGEADFYENLNNDWHTGGGEHSYDTCLETDPQGNFYLFKTGDDHTPTGGCLLKIAKDGSKMEIFATGFRHPIGLGVSPDGRISGADQEGNYMPVTRVDFYKQGGFYGDMRTHHRPVPPTIYDEPFIWLPKEADNSAGGQVWVPKGQWGALGGHMLHLSYGRCKGYAILPDGDRFQGAAVDLGLTFLSGSARARFNPKDGDLYVVGLRGWQTAAQKDGCLQRVRYTGQPYPFPVGYRVEADSVWLTFDQPIDVKSLDDLTKFKVGRCNYRWSADYGSKNWSVLDPKKEGIDSVKVTAAALTEDRRTVTLTLADMRAAMHMKIEYDVRSVSGTPLKGSVYTTIREWK